MKSKPILYLLELIGKGEIKLALEYAQNLTQLNDFSQEISNLYKWYIHLYFESNISKGGFHSNNTQVNEISTKLLTIVREYQAYSEDPTSYYNKVKLFYNKPYSLLETKNLVGRENDIQNINAWLLEKSRPILNIVAIGGMGKSVLSWYYLNKITPFQQRIFRSRIWWTFYQEKNNFNDFASTILSHLKNVNETEFLSQNPRENEKLLLQLLNNEPHLLVLDGCEVLTSSYIDRYNESQQYSREHKVKTTKEQSLRNIVDIRFRSFFSQLAQIHSSKIIITSRVYLSEFESVTGQRSENVQFLELSGLEPSSSLDFFTELGVKGSSKNILELFRKIDFYPLLIQVLAGTIANDKQFPCDFDKWTTNNKIDEVDNFKFIENRIYSYAFTLLENNEKMLLFILSLFKTPINFITIETLFQHYNPNGFNLTDSIQELESRNLINWNREKNDYHIHPITQRVALNSDTLFDSINSEELKKPLISLANFSSKDSFFRTISGTFPYDLSQEDNAKTKPEFTIALFNFFMKVGEYRHASDLVLHDYGDRVRYRDFNYPALVELTEYLVANVTEKIILKTLLLQLSDAYLHLGLIKELFLLFESNFEIFQENYNLLSILSKGHFHNNNLLLAEKYIQKAIYIYRKEFFFRNQRDFTGFQIIAGGYEQFKVQTYFPLLELQQKLSIILAAAGKSEESDFVVEEITSSVDSLFNNQIYMQILNQNTLIEHYLFKGAVEIETLDKLTKKGIDIINSSLWKEHANFPPYETESCYYRGVYYFFKNEVEDAITLFKNSLSIAQEIGLYEFELKSKLFLELCELKKENKNTTKEIKNLYILCKNSGFKLPYLENNFIFLDKALKPTNENIKNRDLIGPFKTPKATKNSYPEKKIFIALGNGLPIENISQIGKEKIKEEYFFKEQLWLYEQNHLKKIEKKINTLKEKQKEIREQTEPIMFFTLEEHQNIEYKSEYDKLSSIYATAYLKLQHNHTHRIDNLLDELISANPNISRFFFLKYLNAKRLNLTNQVDFFLNKCIDLNPLCHEYYFEKFKSLINRNAHSEEIKNLGEAINLAPGTLDYYFLLLNRSKNKDDYILLLEKCNAALFHQISYIELNYIKYLTLIKLDRNIEAKESLKSAYTSLDNFFIKDNSIAMKIKKLAKKNKIKSHENYLKIYQKRNASNTIWRRIINWIR